MNKRYNDFVKLLQFTVDELERITSDLNPREKSLVIGCFTASVTTNLAPKHKDNAQMFDYSLSRNV